MYFEGLCVLVLRDENCSISNRRGCSRSTEKSIEGPLQPHHSGSKVKKQKSLFGSSTEEGETETFFQSLGSPTFFFLLDSH